MASVGMLDIETLHSLSQSNLPGQTVASPDDRASKGLRLFAPNTP